MTLMEGPFLLIGIVAWVAAIVLGVGAWFGAWPWRNKWALASGLAGLGTFELYLYAKSGMLPVLVADANWVTFATAALFVGSGVAVGYGTLFDPSGPPRPVLPEGTAEERLWYLDQIDALLPSSLDWLLTVAMAAPCAGLVYLGSAIVASPLITAVGVVAGLGPAIASVGLWLRRRTARQLEAELDRHPMPEALPARP